MSNYKDWNPPVNAQLRRYVYYWTIVCYNVFMQTPKPDRRVQRTRQLLRQSLLSLILERGYDAVNIQDITDRADVGRATFYLHYTDKEDLLLEVMQSIVDAFEQRIQQIPLEDWSRAEGAPVEQVFLYAGEHAALYQAIMSGQGGFNVSRRLHAIIAAKHRQVVEAQLARGEVSPRAPLDFLCNYFAGSVLTLVFWWLENDQPYSPQEMARMFREVSYLGRAHAMGFNSLPLDKPPH
jgi:AcrR family transcriptional regulator